MAEGNLYENKNDNINMTIEGSLMRLSQAVCLINLSSPIDREPAVHILCSELVKAVSGGSRWLQSLLLVSITKLLFRKENSSLLTAYHKPLKSLKLNRRQGVFIIGWHLVVKSLF